MSKREIIGVCRKHARQENVLTLRKHICALRRYLHSQQHEKQKHQDLNRNTAVAVIGIAQDGQGEKEAAESMEIEHPREITPPWKPLSPTNEDTSPLHQRPPTPGRHIHDLPRTSSKRAKVNSGQVYEY